MQITESTLRQIIREEILAEDVRRRGDQWCAYVDDKLTAAEKEAGKRPKRPGEAGYPKTLDID